MAFNFAHTVGTGYYYSSFHYLGYSPFSAAAAAAAPDGDVKPDIANCPWVSPRPLMSPSHFLQQSYSANPLALYVAVRRCLEQEMKIVEQVTTTALMWTVHRSKFCGFGLGSGVRLLIFGQFCPEFCCKFGKI